MNTTKKTGSVDQMVFISDVIEKIGLTDRVVSLGDILGPLLLEHNSWRRREAMYLAHNNKFTAEGAGCCNKHASMYEEIIDDIIGNYNLEVYKTPGTVVETVNGKDVEVPYMYYYSWELD